MGDTLSGAFGSLPTAQQASAAASAGVDAMSGMAGMFGTGEIAGQAFQPTVTQAGNAATQARLDQAQGFQIAGAIAQIGGAINSEIVRFYQAKQAQYEAKSKASSMRFQADMANINARMAEDEAVSILEAGEQQKFQLTMRAGMEMAQQLTRQGARGIRIGAGSAAETQASLDLVKEIDAYNIDTNAMRQAQSRRMQAVNLRNQGLLGRVSASNIESMAPRSGSLLGTAGRVGSEFFRYMGQQYRSQN